MMQAVFSSLEPIIEKRLNEEKAGLFEFLGDLDQKVQRVLDYVKDIEHRLKKVEASTMALGMACHEAFKQTRDAAECLREELGEASGTITESSFNV